MQIITHFVTVCHVKWVPVTMTWCMLRFWMEEQLTRGGPPAWELGEVLTTSHCKNWSCSESYLCLCLDWSFGTT